MSLGSQPANSRKRFRAPSTEKRATAARAKSARGSSPPRLAARSWEKLPTGLRKCVETQQLQKDLGKIKTDLVEGINGRAEGPALEVRVGSRMQAWQDALLGMHLPFSLACLQPESN